jgi:diadenosine tetraphosphate (Ap4A) HIT family hydrolase
MPPVEDWDTFPFEGEMRPRRLRAPVDVDADREGAGGVECTACAAADSDYLWTNGRWRLRALRPSGLPVVVLLEPRAHLAEPGELSTELAADLGVMLARVEDAVRSVPGVGRVHVCRWGDGSEHMHWWFMARPERLPQLIGSFAAIWDDILPPTPDEVWNANLEHVVDRLRR